MNPRIITLAALVLSALPARATVPDVLTYAGSLRDGAAPANGTFSVVLELFTDRTAGTRVFQQTEASLPVSNGELVVDLGDDPTNPLDDDVLATGALFLQITVNGEALAPRVPLTSAPFARRAHLAEEAETLGGLSADDIANLTTAGAGLVKTGAQLSLAPNGVTSANIADGAVTAADLADGSVGTTKLQPASVTTGAIANGAVGETQLAAGAVTQSKLAFNSVGPFQIADHSIGSSDLASNAVDTTNIADGSIGTIDLGNGVVTAAKISAGAVGSAALAAGAVSASKLGPSAVTNAAIGTNAVTAAKIAPNQINASHLAGGGVNVFLVVSGFCGLPAGALTTQASCSGISNRLLGVLVVP